MSDATINRTGARLLQERPHIPAEHLTDASRLSSSEEVLASAAHEFRLPLRHIKGFVTTLLRTDIDWDDETRKEFIAEIDLETDRLSELVESQTAGRGHCARETAADRSGVVTVDSQVGVLALSKMLEAALVVGAARADTIRYSLNKTNQQESWQAIKAALVGQVQLSPEPVAQLAREMLADKPEQLSDRELDVLRLISRCRSNKQIARDLTIA